MTRSIAGALVLLLFVAGTSARAQDREERAVGIGGRLLAGAAQEDRAPAGLAAAAAPIGAKLGAVDREKVLDLNRLLDELDGKASSLQRMLEDLERGIPIGVAPLGAGDEIEATPDRLLVERSELERLERELADSELRRARQREEELKLAQARRRTRRSEVLLDALAELPKAPAQAVELEPVTTRFPLRTADALYRTGDFRGALRHFLAAREADAASLSPRQVFAMARCHEELGELREAIAVLDGLVAGSADERGFWEERAARLKGLIAGKQVVDRALRPGQERR